MDQEKIIARLFSLWKEGIQDDKLLLEQIQSEFKVSVDEAETIMELSKTGVLKASFIASRNRYPDNNLDNNPIVKTAIKFALADLEKSDSYTKPATKKSWWTFWK